MADAISRPDASDSVKLEQHKVEVERKREELEAKFIQLGPKFQEEASVKDARELYLRQVEGFALQHQGFTWESVKAAQEKYEAVLSKKIPIAKAVEHVRGV